MDATETRPEEVQLSFEAFGVFATLTASAPDLLDRAREVLPPGWQACPPGRAQQQFGIAAREDGKYQVTREGEPVVRDLPLDLALDTLGSQFRLFVSRNSPEKIFVHAGVVACRDRAIVIPGESYAGKTTLVAALVGAGAVYYSDEFAVVDDEGLVHPYPKPLSLRDDRGWQTDHHVQTLGGVAGERALPMGAVVVTSYRPDAEWRPRRGSPGEGALALMANTVPARERPAQAVRTLMRALEGAVVIESERGDAEEVAPLLLAEFERLVSHAQDGRLESDRA